MKKILTLILTVIIIAGLGGCAKPEKAEKTSAEKSKSAAEEKINVTVSEAAIEKISDKVTYTGEVKASETVSVSAKASATAKAVNKEVGDYVTKGEVLVTLDDTDYQTQYNQAQAAYNQAVAQYNSITNGTAQQTTLQLDATLSAAKIEYNNANTNYETQKTLYESGAISKSAYDAALTRYENAKLNLETAQNNYDIATGVVLGENATAAKAAVDSASVQVQAAKNMLANTVVYAPISGYVSARNTNAGQIVAQGVEIFTIKNTSAVDVEIYVTEAVIPSVKIGGKVSVTVKAANKENISGTISNVGAAKDARTGMYLVVVRIDGTNTELKEGMIADVEITLKEALEAIVIPSDAVLESENGEKYVYIADGDSAKRVDIVTGILTDDKVEVVEGINAKDKIVLSGKEYISDKNNAIKIVE